MQESYTSLRSVPSRHWQPGPRTDWTLIRGGLGSEKEIRQKWMKTSSYITRIRAALSEEWSHHPTCLSLLFYSFVIPVYVTRAMRVPSIKYSLRRQWRVTKLHAQHSNKWSFKKCWDASKAYPLPGQQEQERTLLFSIFTTLNVKREDINNTENGGKEDCIEQPRGYIARVVIHNNTQRKKETQWRKILPERTR